MTAQEIDFQTKDSFTMSANTYAAKSHYKFIMRLGRCVPTTRAQAKYFILQGVVLDVLNNKDVEILETIMNKHGFAGDYKYTKSKHWVRLQNTNDLCAAIKKEYALIAK